MCESPTFVRLPLSCRIHRALCLGNITPDSGNAIAAAGPDLIACSGLYNIYSHSLIGASFSAPEPTQSFSRNANVVNLHRIAFPLRNVEIAAAGAPLGLSNANTVHSHAQGSVFCNREDGNTVTTPFVAV